MTPIFPAIVQDGKLVVDSPQDLRSHLRSLEGKRVEVTIERYVRNRTSPQNRYLHGVLFQIIAEDTGQPFKDVKDYLQQRFGPTKFVFDRQVLKSTAEYDTIEMTKFVEDCRLWAIEFRSLRIPEPDQVSA
jgi:hypothetical protein